MNGCENLFEWHSVCHMSWKMFVSLKKPRWQKWTRVCVSIAMLVRSYWWRECVRICEVSKYLHSDRLLATSNHVDTLSIFSVRRMKPIGWTSNVTDWPFSCTTTRQHFSKYIMTEGMCEWLPRRGQRFLVFFGFRTRLSVVVLLDFAPRIFCNTTRCKALYAALPLPP